MAAAAALSTSTMDTSTQSSDNTISGSIDVKGQPHQPVTGVPTSQPMLGVGESQTICLPGVTIHVSVRRVAFSSKLC